MVQPSPARIGRPSRSLVGYVAIVTGAGSAGDEIGNGRAIALLLAEDGASVVCADRDGRLAERTVEMIQQDQDHDQDQDAPPAKAIAVQGDVRRENDCQRVVAAAVTHFGRLDILINNVGVLGAGGTALTVDPDEWARGLEINVTSMMLMAKFAIAEMVKNEPRDGAMRGNIVNMGSVAGLQGGTPSLLYPTSKGAVVNMTRAMAAHHAPHGLRVNCVCPGMLYTPMLYMSDGGMDAATREARRKRSLLKTEGTSWDCAGAVRFLASNEARWITGSVLTVDAGATSAQLVPW